MGLLDRLKELTNPPSVQLPDGDEVPPWLREAVPEAFAPPGRAGPLGAPPATPVEAAPQAFTPPTVTPQPPAYTPAPTPPAYTPPTVAPQPPAYTPAPAPPAYTPPTVQAAPAAPAQRSDSGVVKRLTEVVLESWRSYPLDAETLSLLQVGLPYLTQRDCSRDAVLAGQTAARLGYIARAAEYAEYPEARAGSDELFDALSQRLEAADREGGSIANAMAEFAADLALGEPVDPPPADGSPSWIVPGVGASVRGRLRDGLLKGVPCPGDIARQDLQHCWKYGWFLRSAEELFFDEE